MILDEKGTPLPPPYSRPHPPPPFPTHRHVSKPRLGDLPPHLILEIVYVAFPQTDGVEGRRVERQRRILYWLSTSLRLVSRSVYVACMHVLRSTYLPAYDALIRKPYTSDPFPMGSPPLAAPEDSPYTFDIPSSPTAERSQSAGTGIQTIQRETYILDLFIALKVKEDMFLDDTEYHLESSDGYSDLFDLLQPRARLEDLVRHYGVRANLVSLGSPQPRNAIPFSGISVSFSSRRVGIVLQSAGSRSKRTIVEVERRKEERLETAAKGLIKALAGWIANGNR